MVVGWHKPFNLAHVVGIGWNGGLAMNRIRWRQVASFSNARLLQAYRKETENLGSWSLMSDRNQNNWHFYTNIKPKEAEAVLRARGVIQ